MPDEREHDVYETLQPPVWSEQQLEVLECLLANAPVIATTPIDRSTIQAAVDRARGETPDEWIRRVVIPVA